MKSSFPFGNIQAEDAERWPALTWHLGILSSLHTSEQHLQCRHLPGAPGLVLSSCC